MSTTTDISGLDKAELLAALYNHAVPQGMGFLQATPGDMTKEEAEAILKNGTSDYVVPFSNSSNHLYFDYVKGRPLKVDLSQDEMRTDLYNRDQGPNAAESVIESLRANAS